MEASLILIGTWTIEAFRVRYRWEVMGRPAGFGPRGCIVRSAIMLGATAGLGPNRAAPAGPSSAAWCSTLALRKLQFPLDGFGDFCSRFWPARFRGFSCSRSQTMPYRAGA